MSKQVKLSLGVDLGGTNIRVLVMDTSGRILTKARGQVGNELGFDTVLEKIINTSDEALEKVGESWTGLAGVGIGVAAQVRGDTGICANAPNLGWKEAPLGAALEERLGVSVKVINDLDAIAWAERLFGAAKGHDDVMVVFCGTGVGGGLVLGGRPYHGAAGVACEIGHVKVAGDEGEPCGCGARGCLEAYLGGKNLTRRLISMAGNGWDELAALSEASADSIHPGLLEILACQGDPRATDILDELGVMLGDVLANAVTLLNLSAIILGGSVLKGCISIRQGAERRLLSRALGVSTEKLLVLDDQLGDWAGAMGAAALRY